MLGTLCAVLVGISKTGVPGVGILNVPLIVLAVGDARQSAAWILPMMCVADVYAVLYWRRQAEAKRLFSLVPWVVIGMAAGAAALGLDERVFRPMVGVVVLGMFLAYLWQRRKSTLNLTPHPAVYGVATGFSTTVANAAGPVMNLYLLSKKLTKEEFVATGAWFYLCLNLSKIPIYAWHGLFSRRSLTFDVIMLPAVLAGTLAGRWIIHHIPQRTFESLVIVLTAVAVLLLFR